MSVILLYTFFCLVVSLFVLCLGWGLSFHWGNLYGLSSPFECGFDPGGSSRIGFSLRFFMVMILFIVFDFETVLLIPCVYWFGGWFISFYGIVGLVSFLVLLLVGVLYEMWEGGFEWGC
uniref:NADH-ubiquinone oxidoreductase chain 3 n=1 Tax=Pilsbryoconcha exilis TaxID=178825 RepID=A0A513X0L8_9BIVA|nr:NADH dehydrogenase subunit 3 [Pilsbryoconcha exilis]